MERDYGHAVMTILLSLFSKLFNFCNELILILLIAMTIDFISGTIKGAVLGELDSSVSYLGLTKKIHILFLVFGCALIDTAAGIMHINTYQSISLFATAWFIVHEVESVAENAGQLGVPIPNKVKKSFAIFRSTVSGENENNQK